MPHSAPNRQSKQTNEYFHLVQLSDIHINKYNDRNLNNFKDVCEEIPLIEPDAVVVTGDIAHGRKYGTSNYGEKNLEEYIAYNETITKMLEKYNTI